MDLDKDRDEITYEEYEFVPLAPMNSEEIPQEMKDFMSMCCMMGMMPMNNIMSPIENINLFEEINNHESHIKKASFNSERISEFNDEFGSKGNMREEEEFFLRLGKVDSQRDHEEYNHARIDKIVNKIEKNNPEILEFFKRNEIDYQRGKKLLRRIARLTLLYCN
jgi:hypothetical protein